MTRPYGQRRHTVMAWRRRLALSESRVLRAYLAAAGRLPTCRPTIDWGA